MTVDSSDLIVQHFHFLIDEFNFTVRRKLFDSGTMGNAYVAFSSSRIGIEIVIDRGQVLITLGDQSEPREKWFQFIDVIKVFTPSEDAYIDIDQMFDEKRAQNPLNVGTWREVLEFQLNKLSLLLRQFCEPVLKGDLSMKKEIKEIEEKRWAVWHKQLENKLYKSKD